MPKCSKMKDHGEGLDRGPVKAIRGRDGIRGVAIAEVCTLQKFDRLMNGKAINIDCKL